MEKERGRESDRRKDEEIEMGRFFEVIEKVDERTKENKGGNERRDKKKTGENLMKESKEQEYTDKANTI